MAPTGAIISLRSIWRWIRWKVLRWRIGKRVLGIFCCSRITTRFASFRGKPGAALVICDHVREDGEYVAESPRSVLRRQLELAAAQRIHLLLRQRTGVLSVQSDLSFRFRERLSRLQPSSDYRIDYHLMQPTRDEPLMRAIRNDMTAARVPVESSKGEWSQGQHEINFIYDEPLPMADMHVLFKQGSKRSPTSKAKRFLSWPNTLLPKPAIPATST